MTTRDVEPDPFVRTALRLLPVPEHATAFWADLGAVLDAEVLPATPTEEQPAHATAPTEPAAAPVAAAEPPEEPVPAPMASAEPAPSPETSVVELIADRPVGIVPPGVRRRSNAVLSAVAVAAAVVVVVAGITLVRERDGGTGTAEQAGATDTTPTTDVTDVSDATPTSASMPTLTGSGSEVLPTNAVLGWVGALSTGDIDAAWTAMGPASQAHWGSESAFGAERSGLAEGYGAWASARPDRVIITSLAASGEGEIVVVTLVGTVQQEGAANHRADAFPVRIVDGAAAVEPFAFAGELELVVPEGVPADGERPPVPAEEALVVVVPRGVLAPLIRLDEGDILTCGEAEGTELTELEDAPGQRCEYRPEGGMEAGDRVLTVAFLSPDGTGISAQSVLFEAA